MTGLICLIIASTFSWKYVSIQQNHSNTVTSQLSHQTLDEVNAIQEKLSHLSRIIDTLAEQVSTDVFEPTNTQTWVEQHFRLNPGLNSLAIALKPGIHPGESRYHAPYYERFLGIEQYYWLENYDNGDPQFEWYHGAMQHGPRWTEPYYEQKNNVLMTTYTTPIYASETDFQQQRHPIGVIATDIALADLTDTIREVSLGKTGYAMMFSAKDKLLSHPVFDYVRSNLTRQQLSHKTGLHFLESRPDCNVRKLTITQHDLDDDRLFTACYQLPDTGWTLITTYSNSEDQISVNDRRQFLTIIVTSVLLLLLCLYSLFVGGYSQARLTATVVAIYTGFFTLAVICNWWMARHIYDTSLNNGVPVFNMTDREAFIENYINESARKHFTRPQVVPTGVHLQSAEFRSPNNIFVTGYIWQKYQPEQLKKITPGIIVPEAVSIDITEAYNTVNNDGSIVIGWYLETEIRQPFNYDDYPFDIQHLWLRLWHKEFDKNVLLVPDLESYSMTLPGSLPGLDKNIVLSGWNIVSSQFNLVPHSYNENFGIESYADLVNSPELYFDVVLHRQFLSPFITTLLPVLVIAFLIFTAILNLHSSDMNEIRNTGGALMFTILLAHFSLRESLDLSGVVYFESFYFVLYFMIFILLMIGYQYHNSNHERYKDRLQDINVKLFWPGFTCIIFVISLTTFY